MKKWIEYGNRFEIAGVSYFDHRKLRGKMALGQQVRFIGNPSNLYDPLAIRVMFNGVQIGWVPKDSAIQHGLWAEHNAGNRSIGVITGMSLNMGTDMFCIQALVLKKETPKKLPKAKADIAFSKMREELSYMIK